MTTYRVKYEATASFTVNVDIDDAHMTQEQAHDAAREASWDAYDKQDPGGLCHHCATKFDLGDFAQGGDDAVWAEV